MDPLEEQLKNALQRKQPAPDFAARVTAAAPRPRIRGFARWMPAAAALLVIAGGTAGYRWRQGVVAKREVMTAMRIAGGKLNHMQRHIAKEAQ
jgi:hypothetical protein